MLRAFSKKVENFFGSRFRVQRFTVKKKTIPPTRNGEP
jgi:hypothetical protein